MKEIKKVKLSKALLTSLELKQLRGGGDINNKNSVSGCLCEFNDYSVIENTNSISGCKCSCTNPNGNSNY